ncbi:hypothetical protein ACT3HK_13880, partial [Thermolongibacillus altinsuensis]
QDGKKKYFAMQLGENCFEMSIKELMEIARKECEWVSMNEIAKKEAEKVIEDVKKVVGIE